MNTRCCTCWGDTQRRPKTHNCNQISSRNKFDSYFDYLWKSLFCASVGWLKFDVRLIKRTITIVCVCVCECMRVCMHPFVYVLERLQPRCSSALSSCFPPLPKHTPSASPPALKSRTAVSWLLIAPKPKKQVCAQLSSSNTWLCISAPCEWLIDHTAPQQRNALLLFRRLDWGCTAVYFTCPPSLALILKVSFQIRSLLQLGCSLHNELILKTLSF